MIAGGESRPPTGGLWILDPETAAVSCRYPFRSRTYTSVNAASPLLCGDRVFLTAAYGVGSAVLDVDENGACEERWREKRSLALEFSTPVFERGLVFAVDGVSGRTGAVVALDPATGAERARKELAFVETLERDGEPIEMDASIGAGSVLVAGGKLVVLGDTGHLAVLEYDAEGGFALVSEAKLFRAPEAWTPPVIARGLLYICQNNPARDDQSPRRLLCYDVRGR